jgi:hypothetical protein
MKTENENAARVAGMAEREQRARRIASVIFSQIKAGTAANILQSWGMEKPAAIIMGDVCGLIFHVRGLIHTGRVIVALDEGRDLYDIILQDDNGREVQRITGVYCDELATRIDAAVERPEDMTDAEYVARLKAQNNPLLSWLLTRREAGQPAHIIEVGE